MGIFDCLSAELGERLRFFFIYWEIFGWSHFHATLFISLQISLSELRRQAFVSDLMFFFFLNQNIYIFSIELPTKFMCFKRSHDLITSFIISAS